MILISAQQFMSAVHDRVTGNCATKILGRTGSAEVMQLDYRFLEQDIRMAVPRLWSRASRCSTTPSTASQ